MSPQVVVNVKLQIVINVYVLDISRPALSLDLLNVLNQI
jgi:hypothetical protein